jgi:hypothetical protein
MDENVRSGFPEQTRRRRQARRHRLDTPPGGRLDTLRAVRARQWRRIYGTSDPLSLADNVSDGGPEGLQRAAESLWVGIWIHELQRDKRLRALSRADLGRQMESDGAPEAVITRVLHERFVNRDGPAMPGAPPRP